MGSKNEVDKEIKKEKKKRIWSEIKAFIILAVICGGLSYGTWYWYKNIYSESKNDKLEQKAKNYKYVSYKALEDEMIKVIGDKYVVIYNDDNTLEKVMDLDLNVIYENDGTYSDCFLGADGNLYFYYGEEYNDEIKTNRLVLYKYEDGQINEVKTLATDGLYYKTMYLLNSDNENLIFGYTASDEFLDDDGKVFHHEYIYLLNGQEYELTNYYLETDDKTSKQNDDLKFYSDKYVVVKNGSNKYGVLNLMDNKIVVEPLYDELYSTINGDYIAVKDNKAGIVDLNLKKLVDFNYDFIVDNDQFYVVSLNNKLAIMDSNYNLLTDFNFNYYPNNQQNSLINLSGDFAKTFEAYLVKDKILLINNMTGENKENKEAYLISKDGSYEVLTYNKIGININNEIIWLYNDETKEYTFYDGDFKEKFKLNFDNYDNIDNLMFSFAYGTLTVYNKAVPLYYDLETGQNIANPKDFVYQMDNVELKYNGQDNVVELSIDKEKVLSNTYEKRDDQTYLYNELVNNSFYYCDGKNYFMVKEDN